MKDIFKNIQINIEPDHTFLEFEPLAEATANSKEYSQAMKEAAEALDKEFFKSIILKLIENLTPEEVIEVIKNDEVKDFVFTEDNGVTIKFNKDHYNKWKLNKKLGSF